MPAALRCSGVNRLQPIVEKLADSQQGFLRAADSIAAVNWLLPPKLACWSAAEVVAHLCLVERGVLAYSDRVIRKTPRPVSFVGKLHLPMALVEARVVRRKAPDGMMPVALSGKETMLAELRGVRERTLAFLEETRERDLSAYRWQHPFLGRLNFYDWFTFVAAHQVRHTKQMWEIAKNLPKDVANS